MKNKEVLKTLQMILSLIRIILDVYVICYVLKKWREE